MKRIYELIARYVRKTESYSIPRLIAEFVLLDIALTSVVQIFVFLFLTFFVILPILFFNPHADVNQMLNFLTFNQDIISEATSRSSMAVYAAIFAVIIAPFLETFFFQVFPIWVVSFFTKKQMRMVLTSAVLFALAHVYPLLVLYIFPGGVILAWTFVLLKKRVGGWKAFLATAVIHALFNLINLVGAMVLGYS